MIRKANCFVLFFSSFSFIQVKCDPKLNTAQKFGIMNKLGWAAYLKDGAVMIKRFPYDAKATYPDFGCNNECYTNGGMLEVESVGPLTKIPPGSAIEHVEQWFLFEADFGEDEKEIDKILLPLVRQTEGKNF